MSIIPVEVNEQLKVFAEKEAAKRGCANAGEFLCSLLQSAAEKAALLQKLQEGLDDIERGEVVEWRPGDTARRVRELIQQRVGTDGQCSE